MLKYSLVKFYSSVLISEVSLFQGENNLYKVGTQSSVLINQGVLISVVFFKREVPLYHNARQIF